MKCVRNTVAAFAALIAVAYGVAAFGAGDAAPAAVFSASAETAPEVAAAPAATRSSLNWD
ncbi:MULTISPECIES: hypothetical protein [Streptomyces]|uniref:Secreted protein n=1 Tax=Streptomyces amritsarensis TaxID=681158 RepID=A0ABX3G312_9ACTN|nr:MULTISPECIES: hypothetical protein [Streptomyces]AQT73489.1 hypothetical protein B1K54_19250 [Streptomyces sp. fd1-xmd]MDX6763865.1 hypothetical protein [Streptomyces sp. F8]OLZ67329.1 hypothetical protein AVW11_14025 [Streptomyces amritsarensis]